jgi:hypothetical protein
MPDTHIGWTNMLMQKHGQYLHKGMNCFHAGSTPKLQATGNKCSSMQTVYTRRAGILLFKLSLSDTQYMSEEIFLLYYRVIFTVVIVQEVGLQQQVASSNELSCLLGITVGNKYGYLRTMKY